MPINFTNKEIKVITNEIKDKYAQNPSSNDRRIDFAEKNHNFLNRNEFSRDRDRIIFSKAFRRLEHKAQVYSHAKGDHYRTRLTHTLEVMQIARSIARNLGLNEDLTEAIALGHDIGHTPFGHQGEDVLDGIMRGEDCLGGLLKYKINYCGFKHNFNGLRIVDILEKKYENEKGLNLTWQVLDGILKHTKTKKAGKKWDIDRFIQCKNQIGCFEEYGYPVTLEGQIVAIADEITQRQHDLDDGLRDKELKLSESKIIDYIKETIDEIINTEMKIVLKSDQVSNEEYSGHFDNFITHNLKSNLYKFLEKKDSNLEYISNIEYKRLSVLYKALMSDYKLYESDLPNIWDDNSLVFKLITNHFVADNAIYDKLNEINLLNNLRIKIKDREKNRSQNNEIHVDHLKSPYRGKLKENELIKISDYEKIEEHNWNHLIRDIIDYFIQDVTLNSLKKLNDKNIVRKAVFKKSFNRKRMICGKSDFSHRNKFWNERIYFDTKLIDFSSSGAEFDDKLEKYINYQIINSYNVNIFDGKAIYVVRQLFKAYYTNPRQMPKETLDKLSHRIHENTKLYGCKLLLKNKYFNNDKYLDEIKFRMSNPEEIKEQIKLLKLELDKNEIEKIFSATYLNDSLNMDHEFLSVIKGDLSSINKKFEDCSENYDEIIIQKIFEKINCLSKNDILKETDSKKKEKMMFIKCILEHHYAYLSTICDHIAGMTDNYAQNEYKKLYLV